MKTATNMAVTAAINGAVWAAPVAQSGLQNSLMLVAWGWTILLLIGGICVASGGKPPKSKTPTWWDYINKASAIGLPLWLAYHEYMWLAGFMAIGVTLIFMVAIGAKEKSE